ncbi:GNAT family N-acetyltransferase [Psychrobacillus sp. INOP01]|uniref:GNAT family N-acetyltransferase n=1 Tax=Psychrobacillus sp. INOP01 TaxID=2829187 RepID=UPI001BA52CE3|nr:GNAT family N-acetyltransferase [Psychrobacillus sp. INOP01]QUG43350.1 GNAT family N-acetyltransferase [Psychrobacillus sp. INOP01]
MEILNIQKRSDLFEESVKIFWEQWGNETNYDFYKDCMRHSSMEKDAIPRFYIAIEDNEIIGTYALLRNDINSRQDLYPWLGCLYVKPSYRGRSIGKILLEHGLNVTARLGYEKLYLSSDLEEYYENYGWVNSTITYGPFGGSIKVYEKETELKI